MSLGITLLRKLGLTEEEAQHIDEQEDTSFIFARDQVGIGYTLPKSSRLPDLDSTYARLAAISNLNKKEAPKFEFKPIQNPFYIPSRLKKKDVNSLSNEDLSSIFIQSNSMAEQLENISNSIENPRKRRHRRHRNQNEEASTTNQNSPNIEQTESSTTDTNPPVEDSLTQNENNTVEEIQIDSLENNSQKKHRRRRHHRKQITQENS